MTDPMSFDVRNRSVADRQITVADILAEAKAAKHKVAPHVPLRIADSRQLNEVLYKKRKHYEDRLSRFRSNWPLYFAYATWEASLGEFERARSLMERALRVDPAVPAVWLHYVDLEYKHGFKIHARNVLDRAIAILPLVDEIWARYVQIDEETGELEHARLVFNQWLSWRPKTENFMAFAQFEERHDSLDAVRAILDRLLLESPTEQNFWRYADWEEVHGATTNARQIYETGFEYFGDAAVSVEYVVHFAQFETRCGEHERARAVLSAAMELVAAAPAAAAGKERLLSVLTTLQKAYGASTDLRASIISKRRNFYELRLAESPRDYDLWANYLALLVYIFRFPDLAGAKPANARKEEALEDIRRAFAQAASVPPTATADGTLSKHAWRSFFCLFVDHAHFEETQVRNLEAARDTFSRALSLVPARYADVPDIWLRATELELRHAHLDRARKILGQALGRAPHREIFAFYLRLERQLGNMDRCRILHRKLCEFDPSSEDGWVSWALLEVEAGEPERSMAVFDVAVQMCPTQGGLWDRFIWQALDLGKPLDSVRALHRRRVQADPSLRSWISLALFEAVEASSVESARLIFQEAVGSMKGVEGRSAERAEMVQSWLEFEHEFGDADTTADVQQMMPRRITRRRKLPTGEFQDYTDFLFPDDATAASHLRILEAAQQWKRSLATM